MSRFDDKPQRHFGYKWKTASLLVRIFAEERYPGKPIGTRAAGFESSIAPCLSCGLTLAWGRPTFLQPSMEATVGFRLLHFPLALHSAPSPKRAVRLFCMA
jgi:hypothetical protein